MVHVGVRLYKLDHDEEMRPLHGMYGTSDADLEVQRTTKRAELTAFFCPLRRIVASTAAHVDNKGISDGLWGGEVECIGPMLICGFLVWEEVRKVYQEGTLLEVEHVMARPSRNEERTMTCFERVVTEGTERAAGLAEDGAMLDG